MDSKKALRNQNLEKAFNQFDTDNSGTISADEIKTILGLTGAESVDEKINSII